jgi:hypothetical protein
MQAIIFKISKFTILITMVPHFPAIGSGGMPPVPPTILMSAGTAQRRGKSWSERRCADGFVESAVGHYFW